MGEEQREQRGRAKAGVMEPAVTSADHSDPPDRSSARSDDRAAAPRSVSWVTGHNTVLTIAAASVAPILYLVFVDRYATNSFYGDDWSVAPLIHSALSGHLTLGELWAQYNESRLFWQRIIDVIFGSIDRFDLRSVIFFSAAVFIASYALLLALFREYVGNRLTPIPVLVIGVTWFSLADVENALWAAQVGWYLTVFFLLVMLFALKVPHNRRTLWFAVAVIAALAASLSTIQGFFCWPLGAICIIWPGPWVRRVAQETAIWVGATIVSLALYFPGYDVNNNGCFRAAACSPRVAIHHPLTALKFFFALLGNIIPGGISFGGDDHAVHSLARFEVVGIALFATAIFIFVQSWRFRASKERFPLPLLLIGFSLLWDVTVTLGRSAGGATVAVTTDRYVMANLILLTGIVMYAWARIPPRRLPATDGAWKIRTAWLALLALALFLVVQVTGATGFGLTNARTVSMSLTEEARLIVNEDRVPSQNRYCETYVEFGYQAAWSASKMRIAAAEQLGEFRPTSYRYFRELGPPPLFPLCSRTVPAS
jgi:hypothetical protein